MKALFADISEQARQRKRDADAFKRDEWRQVFALYDAVQIALAKGDHDRVNLLLEHLHAIVDAALDRRRRFSVRISVSPTHLVHRDHHRRLRARPNISARHAPSVE